MSSLNLTPVDQNLLQGSKFSLSFVRLPYVQFFIQDLNIPGISTAPLEQPTPFINVPIAGNKMVYEKLVMTFINDEALLSWSTVNDWIKGYSLPDNFQDYKNLPLQQRLRTNSPKPQFSDGIMTVLTNKNNPILSMNFQDLFPISLSGIQMSTKESAINVLTATAEFGYKSYSINRQV
jgi:hypothetical protein